MTINIGRIGRRRIVSFKVSDDGMVWPSKSNGKEDEAEFSGYAKMIPAQESFRRWKIARKTLATRRKRQGQLRLL